MQTKVSVGWKDKLYTTALYWINALVAAGCIIWVAFLINPSPKGPMAVLLVLGVYTAVCSLATDPEEAEKSEIMFHAHLALGVFSLIALLVLGGAGLLRFWPVELSIVALVFLVLAVVEMILLNGAMREVRRTQKTKA